MNRDFWRLIAVLSVAWLIGLAVGHVALCLLVVTGGYILWLHQSLTKLLDWVRDRKRYAAPEIPGVFEELCREIDYFRDRHKKRKRKLSDYLKQFQAATAALPDGTVVLDSDGDIRWANAAALQYLGVRWPQDAGQRITNLVRHPDLAQVLEPGESQDRTVEIPAPTRPDVHLSIRVVPYGTEQRLFVARDVTRLHRMNQTRSDFVANVSHELRTPLTVISGYLETLAGDTARCPEPWRPALEQMRSSTDRMREVIEELLLLSRLEQDDHIEDPQVVAVPEMLGRICREAQALSGGERHMFSMEADPALNLMGAAQELHSAFSNLVFNAVQYTPERGVIRIRWYRDAAGAHLQVSDTGIGIPADQIPRITERFYRVDRSRARTSGGTGLGLAIVKHVLNRHGATLHVESELGAGSTFRCDFPESVIAPAQSASYERTGRGGPDKAQRTSE